MPSTQDRINEVVEVCRRYGETSIIALAGAPATGKSYVAIIAAQTYAGDPTRVKEVQFHQAFTYEEFMEGLRIDATGAVKERPGVFLDLNDDASADTVANHNYVLLIEELTRANISAVLGELLTYIEHRHRQFETLFSRTRAKVAKNLTILATFNPIDRSALAIDDALLRRLRVIDFYPDVEQLEEMLSKHTPAIPKHVIAKLKNIFNICRDTHKEDYGDLMPFGHGVFSEIRSEADLHPLWHQRLKRILRRPLQDPHPFADTIEEAYPWRANSSFRLPLPVPSATPSNPSSSSAMPVSSASPSDNTSAVSDTSTQDQ